jgi:hypothetical protein
MCYASCPWFHVLYAISCISCLYICILSYFQTSKLPNFFAFILHTEKVRGKSEKIEQVFAIRICIIYNIIKKIASDLPLMSVTSFDNMFV